MTSLLSQELSCLVQRVSDSISAGRAGPWLVSAWLLFTLMTATCGCRQENPAELEPRDASSTQSTELQGDTEGAEVTVDAGERTPDPATSEWDEQFVAVQAGEATLRLETTEVDTDSLEKLTALNGQLMDLLLDAGGVDDTSIALLNEIESLEHLRIRHSPISDDGLLRLQPDRLSSLRILNLPQATITHVGIQHLRSFPNLVQLRLGGPQLDDAAVQAIAKLPKLRSLHLIGPRLTDHALELLSEAPCLDSLYLDDCQLSDSAWEKLFSVKPNLHVHIDQAHHDRDPHGHAHQ